MTIDRDLETCAVNGQVIIVQDDMDNPCNVCIPNVWSFQPEYERPGAGLVSLPVRDDAARAAVVLVDAGRACRSQWQTCAEAGQGGVVGNSFRGTRIANGREGPATA